VTIQASGDPWSLRVLYIFVGAVISGLVGWLSSLYNHYRDARKHHREELKQSVLEPLRAATLNTDLMPTFEINFGPQTYNPNAGVAEYPIRHGPVLVVHQPEITSDHIVEKALLEDARKNHYVDLIVAWEKFSQSVFRHSQFWHKLIEDMAREIHVSSRLPAHPSDNSGGPYVMHLQLAMVVYGRLMEFGEAALRIEQHPDAACLTNGGANWAKGLPEQMKAIMQKMDDLISANRDRVARLRRELAGLRTEQAALVSALSYEMASKRLPGICDLVPFFQL
jgi:hypothetical protein